MTTLTTLVLDVLLTGGLTMLPPALHTLRIGFGSWTSDVRATLLNAGRQRTEGMPPSMLRKLTLPDIRDETWPYLQCAFGRQLTALESLGQITTEGDSLPAEQAIAYEFPEMRRFSCRVARLVSLRQLRMPALQMFAVSCEILVCGNSRTVPRAPCDL
jgi:hypothetical protein